MCVLVECEHVAGNVYDGNWLEHMWNVKDFSRELGSRITQRPAGRRTTHHKSQIKNRKSKITMTPPTPPAIVIDDLHYAYPPLQPAGASIDVLRGVKCQVARGELVALIGRVGGGKTTLCMSLNGLAPQVTGGRFRGRVTVAGLDTRRHPVAELARWAGLVFQDPEAQLTQMCVEDEIAFGPENLGLPAGEIGAARRVGAGSRGAGGLSGPLPAAPVGRREAAGRHCRHAGHAARRVGARRPHRQPRPGRQDDRLQRPRRAGAAAAAGRAGGHAGPGAGGPPGRPRAGAARGADRAGGPARSGLRAGRPPAGVGHRRAAVGRIGASPGPADGPRVQLHRRRPGLRAARIGAGGAWPGDRGRGDRYEVALRRPAWQRPVLSRRSACRESRTATRTAPPRCGTSTWRWRGASSWRCWAPTARARRPWPSCSTGCCGPRPAMC